MFSAVESLGTKRPSHWLVASSIMAISRSGSPRPSNQSWVLVSHCTNSPKRLRRDRHSCTFPIFSFRGRHSLASIIHFRTVSRLTFHSVLLSQVFARQRRSESSI